jgi:hypothetical protein
MRELQTYVNWLFLVGPLVTLLVVVIANRMDREEGEIPNAPVSLYWLCAMPSFAFLAFQAVKHPCSYLEPWSAEWILLGCLWGSM